MHQIVVPPELLDAAEAKWAPPDDPVFQLVPPDFESQVVRCFEDMGKPDVTFDTFWYVYCGLRDLVEIAVPSDVVITLSENTRDDADGVLDSFALAHLGEPELEGIMVEVDDIDEDIEGVIRVEFTNEEGGDQLL